MMTVTINNEKNGIEIRFESKPETTILEQLKENGFRWSVKQKMWYAKKTNERITFIQNFDSIDFTAENKPEKQYYSLWDMTRTDTIENNYEKYHITNTKEIAAILRKHLRGRFPMCKWSIRSDYNSIHINILVSPFALDSDELKAITHYTYEFAESYNYNHSDYYSDYFDVNFYGVYERNIVDKYDYIQREITEEEKAISESFRLAKEEFNKAEAERKAKEAEEAMKRREEERKEAEIRAAKRQEEVNKIETQHTEYNVNYFVINAIAPSVNKLSSVEEILDDGEYHKENCKVAREIHFAKDVYELFVNNLLEDFTFLDGMGGTATDDLRIQSMIDYEQMDSNERKTVKWYNNNCVAIFCDNELKLIINPEGFSYARYTFIVDEETKIINEHQDESGISEEEYQHNLEIAQTIEEAGISLILSNNIGDKWDTEKYSMFRKIMVEWIYNHPSYKPTTDIIRAITNTRFKAAMYRMLKEPENIMEQFSKSNLSKGQRITIITFGDFGGIVNTKSIFDSIEYGEYAQYKEAVKLIYKPERKRNLYYNWYYNGKKLLIFDGWFDIPESLLWEEVISDSPNVMSMRKTRFTSCDPQQFDVILDYFDSIGIRPIINTYKPQF